jgi:hypothetical protein
LAAANDEGEHDLPHNLEAVALIGDQRNGENIIVTQLQLASQAAQRGDHPGPSRRGAHWPPCLDGGANHHRLRQHNGRWCTQAWRSGDHLRRRAWAFTFRRPGGEGPFKPCGRSKDVDVPRQDMPVHYHALRSLLFGLLRRSLLQRAPPFGARRPWGLKAAGLCRRVANPQRLPQPPHFLAASCCAPEGCWTASPTPATSDRGGPTPSPLPSASAYTRLPTDSGCGSG